MRDTQFQFRFKEITPQNFSLNQQNYLIRKEVRYQERVVVRAAIRITKQLLTQIPKSS